MKDNKILLIGSLMIILIALSWYFIRRETPQESYIETTYQQLTIPCDGKVFNMGLPREFTTCSKACAK